MNIEDKILIEKKLREGLSKEEQDFFSSKIEKDENFRKEYADEKQLFENLNEGDWNLIENKDSIEINEYHELFKSEETTRLAKIFADHSTQHRNKKKPKQRNRKLIWLSGAAAAILLLLISVFTFLQISKSTEELYYTYLDTSEVPSLIPRGNDLDNSLIDAQDLFGKGKYEDALIAFDKVLESNSRNRATLLLYKGISEMEIGKHDSAVKSFDMLIESDLIDATKGYWYKALLYLKTGEKEKSIVLFDKIKSELLYNHKKAELILKEL